MSDNAKLWAMLIVGCGIMLAMIGLDQCAREFVPDSGWQ